jgi:hypothetical protein
MQYSVELETSVFITVRTEAGSRDEAVTNVLASLPKYPVAAMKADQFDGRPNPVEPDDIHVNADWHVCLVQDAEGDEVWE